MVSLWIKSFWSGWFTEMPLKFLDKDQDIYRSVVQDDWFETVSVPCVPSLCAVTDPLQTRWSDKQTWGDLSGEPFSKIGEQTPPTFLCQVKSKSLRGGLLIPLKRGQYSNRHINMRPCLNNLQKEYCVKIKVIALDWQWVTLRSWRQMNRNGHSSPVKNKVEGKPHKVLEKWKITSGKSNLFGHFFKSVLGRLSSHLYFS